jgi:2-dehydro-3-deoxyglucarate aldolase/4-hydroxy-2-oxoheptanedioate aldolase
MALEKSMNLNFRKRLKEGELLVGSLVTIPSPGVAEVMAEVGFDWLFIDTEHGAFNAQEAQDLLRAADHRCPCVIRIPSNEEVWIKKALDIGATGIIAPGVNTAEEAERIVRMCKYPPRGRRGVGIGRAHGYGLRFKEYVARANDEIAVILQAENIQAVEHIAEIAGVPDLDAILVGPYDLSASMDKMGKIDAAEVQAAMAKITAACRQAGIPLGIFADSAESAAPFIRQGYTLIAVSTDALFMAQGAKAAATAIKAG